MKKIETAVKCVTVSQFGEANLATVVLNSKKGNNMCIRATSETEAYHVMTRMLPGDLVSISYEDATNRYIDGSWKDDLNNFAIIDINNNGGEIHTMNKGVQVLDQFIQDFYAAPTLDRAYFVCHLLGGMLEDNPEFDSMDKDVQEKIEKASEILNYLYQHLGSKKAEDVHPDMIHGRAFVTIYQPVKGWCSLLVTWDDELNQYTPEQPGMFGHPEDRKNMALVDAIHWALSSDLPFHFDNLTKEEEEFCNKVVTEYRAEEREREEMYAEQELATASPVVVNKDSESPF